MERGREGWREGERIEELEKKLQMKKLNRRAETHHLPILIPSIDHMGHGQDAGDAAGAIEAVLSARVDVVQARDEIQFEAAGADDFAPDLGGPLH